MSSRLFQKVREEKGLAYSVYSMSSAFVEDGIFLIYAGVGEGNERVTADAIREETELLAREGVGEAELAKAREQNKGHYIFNQENVSGRMFSAGRNYLLHGRGYTAEEIIGGIDAVTCEDIKRVAARYADLADYTSVHIGKKQLSARDMGL